MSNTVYIRDRAVTLTGSLLGRGNEAIIYDLGGDEAVKVYRQPDDPFFRNKPADQQASAQKIKEYAEKLAEFPPLPQTVVGPRDLAWLDRQQTKLAGYKMQKVGPNPTPLYRYGEEDYRLSTVNSVVCRVLQQVCRVIDGVHQSNVVVGDLTSMNILITQDGRVWMVDADSLQYGKWNCPMFTIGFADPRLLKIEGKRLTLTQPHDISSDWYAVTAIILNSLLLTDAYGGVYRGQGKASDSERQMLRYHVLHPQVGYPHHARPTESLPDDLLHYFTEVLSGKRHDAFPIGLLDIAWRQCPSCGLEHSRVVCPSCTTVLPLFAIPANTQGINVHEVFRTKGYLLNASFYNGKLNTFTWRNNTLYANDEALVFTLQPDMTFNHFQGEHYVAAGRGVYSEKETISVDLSDSIPAFTTNTHHIYYVADGKLMSDGEYGPITLGVLLRDRTRIWVGEKFGIALAWFGAFTKLFIFDAERAGLIEANIEIPFGEPLDMGCTFDSDKLWFFMTIRDGSYIYNHCWFMKRDGTLISERRVERGSSDWLGGIHGNISAGNGLLLTPTTEGIVQVGNDLGVRKTFPNTADYVNKHSKLLLGPEGLYVMDRQTIKLVKLI